MYVEIYYNEIRFSWHLPSTDSLFKSKSWNLLRKGIQKFFDETVRIADFTEETCNVAEF